MRQTVLGCDPGLAASGISILGVGDNKPVEILELKVVQTKKLSGKKLKDIRISDDDQKRLTELWNALQELYNQYSPVAIGVESFAIFPGRVSGWKSGLAYQLVCDFARHVELEPMIFLPGDLKAHFTNKRSASKKEVEDAMAKKIHNFGAAMKKIAKTKAEHVSDATGHAYLAWSEMYRLRKLMGVGS
jgi:Holliday junction resolvasome RuvABC endonuclease subunit